MHDRDNRPISEQYRVAGQRWSDLNGATSMLEECKSAFLSQKMAALGDMPVSRAELTVKATQEWKNYIVKMVRMRTDANLARVELEYLKMRGMEQSAADATARIEMRMVS